MNTNNYATEYLQNRFDDNFFLPNKVTEWRKPSNSLEANGVFFNICFWVSNNIQEEYNWERIYNNIHGWRDNVYGGSFNPDYNYPLYDNENRLEITDFILQHNSVYAEVTDTKKDKVVGYILIS